MMAFLRVELACDGGDSQPCPAEPIRGADDYEAHAVAEILGWTYTRLDYGHTVYLCPSRHGGQP